MLEGIYSYAGFACLLLTFMLCTYCSPDFYAGIIFSLFLTVDNGGGIYGETAWPIRYTVILASILILLRNYKANMGKLANYGLYLCLIVALTAQVVAFENYDLSNLVSGTIILILALLVYCRSNSSLKSFKINLRALSGFIIVYACGEFANIMFFSSDQSLHYLSYDGSKILIAMPLFMLSGISRILIVKSAVSILICIVLLYYQSRMIILTVFAMLIGMSFLKSKFSYIIITGLACLTIILPEEFLIKFRFYGKIWEFFQQSEEVNLLVFFDPVRYYEYKLFFERPIIDILFGQGLGAGIFDKNNYMSFVSYDQTAFTENEIRTSIFYNFHDLTTDLGLRLGIIPILVMMLPPMRHAFGRNSPQKWSSAFLAVVLVNAFYSTIGLVICTYLYTDFLGRGYPDGTLEAIERKPTHANLT